MVSAPIIAKSLAGVGALGAGSAGVYHYKDVIKEYLYSNPVSFIVKAKAKTDDFLTSNKCFSSKSSSENAHCEIRKVDFGTEKFVDLKTVNKSSSSKVVAEKEKFSVVKDAYYKLTVDTTRFNTSISYGTTDIFMKSKEKTTEFAEFTIVALLNKKEPKTDNSLVLVKVTKGATASETVTDTDSKCKIGSDTEEIKCIVYKFTPDLKDLSSITFSKKGAKATDVQVTDNDFLVIDFSGVDSSKKTKLNTDLKTITWSKSSATEETKKTTLTFEASLSGTFDTTEDGKNEIYLLKNIPTKPTKEAKS